MFLKEIQLHTHDLQEAYISSVVWTSLNSIDLA